MGSARASRAVFRALAEHTRTVTNIVNKLLGACR